jgi:inosine/xanthosine triphosphate pyrophosphatase family protein
MVKKILFGSKNPAKFHHMRTLLKDLPLEIVDPEDLGIDLDVVEDGKLPEDNARGKARAYHLASCMPTFSIDAGLFIDRFPPEKQPGPFVRRIFEGRREATDEEMLDYYTRELGRIGGESKGRWITAIALAISPDKILSETFSRSTFLTARRSRTLIPGAPLGSIQMDPTSGKFYSEMTYEERGDDPETLGIVAFLEKNMEGA